MDAYENVVEEVKESEINLFNIVLCYEALDGFGRSAIVFSRS